MIGPHRLDRYIASELARGYLVVTGILAALFSLVGLLEELEEVGEGGYGMIDAMVFVAMTLPSQMLALLPFITLLGACLVIWQLARRSELVVLRAAGMSLVRLGGTISVPGLILVVLVPLLHEYVAPSLYRDAMLFRDSQQGRIDNLESKGFWARRGTSVVHVDTLQLGRVPSDVRIYEFGVDGELVSQLHAASADPRDDGGWLLIDIERRSYAEDRIEATRVPLQVWYPWWRDASQLETPAAQSLSFSDLYGYIDFLQRNDQATQRWELTFWRMWLLPVTALLTGLLALPLALSGQRQSDGRNVALALFGGLVFYFGDQIVANAGVLAGLPPVVIAIIPPVMLALVVVAILRRVR